MSTKGTKAGRTVGVALLTLGVALLAPRGADASFLGLDSGTYDVELTCIITNCGGPFTGVLTTDGSDITDWRFDTDFDSFPLSFRGDPTEFSSGGPPADFEKAFGPALVFGDAFTLVLFGADFAGDWSIGSNDVSFWRGTWAATPHDESGDDTTGTVPEPASTTLLALGVSLRLWRGKPSR